MNVYLLSFNPFATNFSYNQLLSYIKDNRKVYQFYSPYAGTYILKSTDDTASLQDSFKGFFEGSHFIITKLHVFETGGFLNQEAWNWMAAGQNPFLPGN
ncbi:hypothetical protein [Alteriqipengyuania lutimaris]|uniref:Uncharacterized protein n=1 Tax=Alteriqipengyuania lutimaris TaxID=1538146 RepID=A0A395LNH0_9SPHN|nr:hypothetical protein [Alteriqipengyuania lutimaris]MBB3032977.1 hypothetical protein [Alteriqipengyuania lutimaris]RDS77947.1 hypothetical protein DL238_10275 [Alteriqipengyuania lutimaris]